jgi:hypothetical protein
LKESIHLIVYRTRGLAACSSTVPRPSILPRTPHVSK